MMLSDRLTTFRTPQLLIFVLLFFTLLFSYDKRYVEYQLALEWKSSFINENLPPETKKKTNSFL